MEVQNEGERTVEIDSDYYLMQVFNAINQERSSLVFIFNGVKFWREQFRFKLKRDDRVVDLGEILDFGEFEAAVKEG